VIEADLVTVDANTIHGPKGVGGLYIRQGTPIRKWMDGGFQEFDLRPGAENIPGAVGFAAAAELATPDETARLQAMRDRLFQRLLAIPNSRVNGHPTARLPQNANVSFRFVEGESLLLHLDMRGYAVSTGSACFSRSLEASHVIMGIGGNHERAHGSVRMTVGRFNTDEEIEGVADALSEVVAELRRISPLGKQ
jgi:cysteine desulfurase